ncbi:MAG: DUF4349 domain-containing protein [Flavobacteriales bacterium]|nr:DUF4349 domain-containing protein [Flavobacteriales bacterium]MCC6938817.1 DUF4349 domain-containing protein [Flavobacteriales bacterium]
MNRNGYLLLTTLIILTIAGCGRSADQESMRKESTSATPMAADEGEVGMASTNSAAVDTRTMSSSAALTTGDTSRRFIRTADLRFRVKDVVQATYAIEDLVAAQGGHVEHTHLSTRVDEGYTTPISADSVLETTKYTVMNTATLRVPAAKLDTTLKLLARFVDFLDHRTVKAEDVRLMLLSNTMTQQRVARHEQRLTQAIDEQGRKLKETMPAEDRLLDRQEQADQAALSNMGLEDRIAYSTITLELYQRRSVRHDLLPNERNIEQYRPGFFSQLGTALADGWDLLTSFVLLISRMWSVLLIIVVGFLALRRIFRRKPQGVK